MSTARSAPLLFFAACAHPGISAVAAPMEGASVPPPACECPGAASLDQQQAMPSKDDVLVRMAVIEPELRACFREPAIARVSYFLDGKTGRVTELTLEHGNRGAIECVRRAFNRMCFAPFRQRRFGVSFPFKLPGRSTRDVAATKSLVSGTQCWTVALAGAPPSAAADPGAEARREYTARYTSLCRFDAEAKPPQDTGAVSESVPQDTSQAVLAQHMTQVSACYDEALAGWPALVGRVEVTLRLSPSGTVQDTWIVEADPSMALVACCIREATRAWAFPAPSGGEALVHYPFSFRP